MDKGIEALREAVRRAPLTKPEGLSPEWQAYFDAVTPLHVAGLIASLEQALQENKERSARIEELESQRQLAFMASNRWRDKCVNAEKRIAELESRSLCVKSNDAMREAAPLCVKLPDSSSKAFWSGVGKTEKFHPETYKRWVKEAIERAGDIAGIKVEVK